MTIAMPVEPEANELLTRSPLALLIGMVLDQQVPLERAFSAPLDLVRRLGHEPTTVELADFDPVALAGIFSERPALHRYPKAMAARVQNVARLIVDQYDGEPERLWTTAKTGPELLKRVSALPGFGAQKAQIFVALLGKQLGVRPRGWREAAGPLPLPSSVAGVDPYLNSVQWSRRFLGLRLFLSLAAAGWDGLGAHVERSVEVVERVKEGLVRLGWTVANDSALAVLDAVPPAELGPVRDLVRRVVASGRAWVAPTTFEGRDVVRICATNGETTLEDVDALIAVLNECA